MSRPSLETGFEFWRDEVGEPDFFKQADTPYIPAIALVGLYVALYPGAEPKTSYGWRQAILQSPAAKEGLRNGLVNLHSDHIDKEYVIPLRYLVTDNFSSNQAGQAHQSLLHGLPKNIVEIKANELFLATALGFARHDEGVGFNPDLHLTPQGQYAVKSYYPKTAKFIRNNS